MNDNHRALLMKISKDIQDMQMSALIAACPSTGGCNLPSGENECPKTVIKQRNPVVGGGSAAGPEVPATPLDPRLPKTPAGPRGRQKNTIVVGGGKHRGTLLVVNDKEIDVDDPKQFNQMNESDKKVVKSALEQRIAEMKALCDAIDI